MALTSSVEEIIEKDVNRLLGKHPLWERVKLGDIADVQNGAPYDSARFNNEGNGMPLLRIRDVGNAVAAIHYDGPHEGREIVRAGDLVIGMDGDFNCAHWRGEPALLNQRVCRINFTSDLVNPMFVYHLLPGYLEAVNEATPSVTVKHLSSKTVADLMLPLPAREVQDSIVEKLSRVFDVSADAVAELEEILKLIQELEASALATALNTGADVREIGEIAETQLGKMLSSKATHGEGQRPYLRNKNVQWGRFDLSDVLTMAFSEAETKKFSVRDGDLLVCEGGEIGRCAIWRSELEEVFFQKALHRVRPSNVVRVEWLYHSFRWLALSGGFDAFVSGVAIPHLPQEDLRKIVIPVPSLAEQDASLAKIAEVHGRTEQLRAEVQGLVVGVGALKRAAVRAAVSGELTSIGSHEGSVALKKAITEAREARVLAVKAQKGSARNARAVGTGR